MFRTFCNSIPKRKLVLPTLFSRSMTTHNIFYMTDAEGAQFFFNALNKNNIVKYDPQHGLYFNPRIKDSYFIYGGDVTDRGSYDLRLTKLLVDFKKNYPGRVKLLVGNRDISKNRIKIELAPNLIKERLQNGKHPRWLKEKRETTLREYIIWDMVKKLHIGVSSNDSKAINDYIHGLTIEESQLIYLQWMLKETMGCPHSFRYRHEELARNTNKSITDISHQDVLNSFIKESTPNGLMGQYLQHAQVGVIFPNSGILAVHGGLTEENIGRLPGMPAGERISEADIWIKKFNEWYSEQIKQWISLQPQTLTEPACTKLDGIVLPLEGQPKTIITADMLGKDRSFVSIPSTVSSYMLYNRLKVVLTGHQPCGDHPTILRGNALSSDYPAVLSINGDTGYSRVDHENPDDTRGNVCHAIELASSPGSVTVKINATVVNPDHQVMPTTLTVSDNKISGDHYIGRLLSDGRLVQCLLSDGQYRLVQQIGQTVNYTELTTDELENILLGMTLEEAAESRKYFSVY